MKKGGLEKSTILSAALFELLIINMTVTPYGSVENANQFGDKGMLYSMVLIALMYGIPLVFYKLRVLGMKYILAVVIGICTIGAGFIFVLVCLPTILPAGVLGYFFEQLSEKDYFTSAMAGIICLGAITCNVMWYMKAFSKQE